MGHLAGGRVLDALTAGACPICVLVTDSVEGYLVSLAREQINDSETRTVLRRSLGCCAPHSRSLAKACDPLGTAILYRDLLGFVLPSLDAIPPTGFRSRLASFSARRPDQRRRCPACRVQKEAEDRYLGFFLGHIDDPDVTERYADSPGLCVPHLRALWRIAPTDRRERLRLDEARRLMRLREQLAEVIRKNDYRYARESWGEEREAPWKAVAKMAGEIGGVAPRSKHE